MTHNSETYQKLLSQFQESYTRNSDALFKLVGITGVERDSLPPEQKRRLGEILGFVSWQSVDGDRQPVEEGFQVWWAITGLDAKQENRVADAVKEFETLAGQAGAATSGVHPGLTHHVERSSRRCLLLVESLVVSPSGKIFATVNRNR